MQSQSEVGGRHDLRITYAGAIVTVRGSKAEPTISGALLDISVSGCRVSVPEPLTVTSEQMIEVCIDLTHLVVRALGFVKHINKAENSFGIEFHKLSDQQKADLNGFIQYATPL
jgi:c-di-GMP-binding flagellar brake protein YcgR